MNIVSFWKELASSNTNFDFNGQDIERELDEHVPDWRQQIKNKEIWPDLHCQTTHIRETEFTKVIIDEVGSEFACYLIETHWGKRYRDAYIALDYCAEHLYLWDSFSNDTKDKILTGRLIAFISNCIGNVQLWQSLTDSQKRIIFDNIEEEKYVSDILLFNIWSEILNYKITPYLVFATSKFRILYDRYNSYRNRDDDYKNLMETIDRWDIPELHFILNRSVLSYKPSFKMQSLKEVATAADDNESVTKIDNITKGIKMRLEGSRMW